MVLAAQVGAHWAKDAVSNFVWNPLQVRATVQAALQAYLRLRPRMLVFIP